MKRLFLFLISASLALGQTIPPGVGVYSLSGFGSGSGSGASSAVFTSTASATVANTLTETSIVGTGTGSKTTAANYFTVGSTFVVEATGFYSSAAVDTLNVKIKYGSNVAATTGAIAYGALTNKVFTVRCLITCRTTGASGTFIANTIWDTAGSALIPQDAQMLNTTTFTLDTTTTQVWDLTAQWSAASASDTITGTNFALYTIGSSTGGGGGGTVTSVGFTGGLISVGTPTTTPAFTVAGTSGGIPYFSSTSAWGSSSLLAANALMIGGGAGVAPSTTTTAANILTFLGSPSSANLGAALTDKTGTGLNAFQNTPTFITPILGAATATSINGLGVNTTGITALAGPIQTATFIDITNNIANPANTAGRVFYDNTEKALSYFNENASVTVNLGQEQLIRVINNSGSTIANGVPVYISGAGSSLPQIALASASAEATSRVAGVTTNSITNGSTGYICVSGVVHGMDTSAFTVGVPIFLGTTAGTLTATAPTGSNYIVQIGNTRVNSASVGELVVTPLGGRIASTGGVISGLTTNTIPKATSSTTIGDSLLIDDGTSGTYSGTGGLKAALFTGTGTTPAAFALPAGTGSIPTLPANSAGFAAPATGGTSWLGKLPATITAGLFTFAAPATADGVNESAVTSSPVGTGILAALAVNTGSAGAPVLFNGAGGSPTSITLPSAAVATTQTAADNSTKVATTAYADRAARNQSASVNLGNLTGTINIDWSAGTTFRGVLTGNTTFTFSNGTDGQTIIVDVAQTGTNTFTVTWPTMKWSGGVAPTMTTGAATDDITTIVDFNAVFKGNSVQNVK
jgi:hypothetical protein